MYNKQTKRYTPEADGNINMMRNFINCWKTYRPEDEFFVMMPSDIFNYEPVNLNIDCQFFAYKNYVISSRINRYNFPMAEFIPILKKWGKFDLVINDVTELARNIKMMFKVELGYEPKILSNLHHIDEELNLDYMFSVADGINCSDYVTILSESMRKMLKEQLDDMFQYYFVGSMMEKINIFEPSVSVKEIDSVIEPYFLEKKGKIITFPGRLSKGEENRTNWDKFMDAIIKLREIRQDFIVCFTDPNNSIKNDLKLNYIRTIKKNRNDFLEILNSTDIVVSLMDIQGFGGISIREALLSNCLPIIPYKHEYKNMAPPEYNGFIHGEITSEKLVEKLNWSLDQSSLYDIRGYGLKYSIENQMKDLMIKMGVI
jgi:hypothetical protein